MEDIVPMVGWTMVMGFNSGAIPCSPVAAIGVTICTMPCPYTVRKKLLISRNYTTARNKGNLEVFIYR